MMIKIHRHHPFLTVARETSAWYSCKKKPNANDCTWTLSQLRHTVLLSTQVWMNTTECVQNRLNPGAALAERASWCDEIHLNVIMISVCSPPSCIFVKEEEEKRTEHVNSFPCHLIDFSVVKGGHVEQCVPYLKKMRHLLELVCTISKENHSKFWFNVSFKNVVIHLFIKVLLQFLLHSPQLL